MISEGIPVPDLGTPEPREQLPPVAEQPVVEETPKRSRSRRRGAPPPAATAPVETPAQPGPEEAKAIADALALGFKTLAQIVASKRGEHWLLGDEQANLLGVAWGSALGPYLTTSAKYVPWATALIVTAGVALPRIQQDAANAAAVAEQQQTPNLEATAAGLKVVE